MSMWTEPSPSDFERWEARLLDGQEPSTAARADGHTCSAFRRADPDRHAAALELSREARGCYADERGETWAQHPEASDQLRLAWLKRWQPAWAGASKVEVTGADGGPIEFDLPPTKLAEAAAILEEARRSSAQPPPDPVHPA